MHHRDGYVVDVPYVYTFWHDHTPLTMSFAALAAGYKAPLPEKFNYLELGCGYGYAVCLQAALYPEGTFYGVDFIPEHIAHGKDLADNIGLTNAHFQESSFRELLDRIETLPQMDYVCLHGIYTWVNDENRAILCEILRRIVKPGGLVYNSYNAMPGNATTVALQTFLMEYGRVSDGLSPDLAKSGLDEASKISKQGAQFFANNPAAQTRLESCLRQDANYLAHEFMHTEWKALPFGDVERAMNKSDLKFIGAAKIKFSLDEYNLSKELTEKIHNTDNVIWRETLLDYALGRQFRQDIYIKSGEKLSDENRISAIKATGIVMIMDDHIVSDHIKSEWGVSSDAADTLIKNLMERESVTIGKLFDIVKNEIEWDKFITHINKAISSIHFALGRNPIKNTEAVKRYNSYALNQNKYQSRYTHLCFAKIGTAMTISHRTALLFRSYEAHGSATPLEHMERVMVELDKRGQKLQGVTDNQYYTTLAKTEMAAVAFELENIKVPYLKRMGLTFDD